MASAQVKVETLDQPAVEADDFHHLAAVLRLRKGEAVAVIDGSGGWAIAKWTGEPLLEPDGPAALEPAQPVSEVAFALTKGSKPELVVQKLTELGVSRIVPFVAERSIVQWDQSKQEANWRRFRRIAYEAAMQSRRVWLPEVATVSTTASVSASGAAAAHFGGSAAGSPSIAVGPEGGWSEAELSAFRDQVSLGTNVLRAETAAIVAGVHVTSFRST